MLFLLFLLCEIGAWGTRFAEIKIIFLIFSILLLEICEGYLPPEVYYVRSTKFW